jgi:hypothetical protein
VRLELPRIYQLEKYVPRLKKHESNAYKIIAMSECNSDYASRRLSISKIKEIPRQTLSGREIAAILKSAMKHEKFREKHLLKDLLTYLGRVATMQDIDSNWVYVVAVGGGTHHGWKMSWIDGEEKRKKYLH